MVNLQNVQTRYGKRKSKYPKTGKDLVQLIKRNMTDIDFDM